jgi:hypothetical protein
MHRTVGGSLMVLTLAALAGGGVVTAAETMTPLERAASTPKGLLNSPYPDFAGVAEEGRRNRLQWLPRRWRWRGHGRAPDQSCLDLRR